MTGNELYEFKCPECGSCDLMEHAEKVTTSGNVGFHRNGAVFLFDENVNWYSAECVYECQDCGFEVPVTKRADLLPYLVEHGMVEVVE